MKPDTTGQESDETMNTPSPAEDQPINTTEATDSPDSTVSQDEVPAPQEDPSDEAAEVEEETPAPVAEAEADTSEADADTPAETATDADDAPEETEADTSEADADTPAETATDADDAPEETEAQPEAAATASTDDNGLKRGDLIEGTITSTSPTAITVDIGDGREGTIPGRELERMRRKTLESLEDGERILVFVVNPNDHEGNIILSINRAIEEMDWTNAEEYRKDETVYEGNVAGYNKGGLIVRFGSLRGFVPQSQIADSRQRSISGDTPEKRFGGMVNEKIFVKVMEVDRSRNRLILSERAATRERREQRKEELIEELTVGEVREGRVVSLEDFGAFVDVGGAEGLVHLTEIAWKHVTHPRDVLKVGQTVKVEVISVDPKRKRIGLSIKRQEADPWDEVATTFQVGDLVKGRVTKLTKFGAFAQLIDAEEIEGLVHISELSENRVGHPREVVSEDEELTLRVVKIDVKNRRLGLSLKAVNSAEYMDHDWG